MLELSNIAVPLDAALPGREDLLRQAAAKKLQIHADGIASVRILKKSVDARKKSDVHFVMTLGVNLLSEDDEATLMYGLSMGNGVEVALVESWFPTIPPVHKNTDVRTLTPEPPLFIPEIPPTILPENYLRPVVVGTGPAGLFAALYLAKVGLRPLVLERGCDVDGRVAAVERFEREGILDPSTNIQFGEGGAGTFSDGKLTTNTKNPLTKTVLEWFAQAGAPEEILIDAKPHIGTDKLRQVVKTLRQNIQELGGEVRFNTCLEGLEFQDNALQAVVVRDTKTGAQELIPARAVILATGHSARDTFAMLQEKGLFMERKPFSVGVRIEHPQALINCSQYGEAADHPALGAADYKLSAHLKNGRGVYTFCMCPGGQVVAAASEEGGVCVNGMSVHARDGKNANSAVLVGVEPSDFPGTDPLAGVAFQRKLERDAYELARKNGGGPYVAPAQRVGDFLAASGYGKGKAPSCEKVKPTYARGVAWSDLRQCLPDFVADSLAQGILQFDRRLKGFASSNAVMTAVETRSSSPVRVVRDKQTLLASLADGTPVQGVYPCGEGAGYAGGIMSAAVDGLRVAQEVAQVLSPIDFQAFCEKLAPNKKTATRLQEGIREETPVPAGEEREYLDKKGNRFTYVPLTNGNVRLLDCKNEVPEVECPTFIDDVLVSEISSRAFLNATDIFRLTLPAGITRMEPGLLRQMKNLDYLALPDAIGMLDTSSLSRLSYVGVLCLPSMMRRVPVGLFRGCTIDTLRIGRSTDQIIPGAFENSTLKRVEVSPDNQYFFTDGQGIYRKSDFALVALAVPSASYEVVTGCTRICHKAFSGLSNLEQVFLPDTVEVIEPFAFFRSGLTAFVAPPRLKSIGEKAFYQCSSLQEIELNPSLGAIESDAFINTALKEIEIPAGVHHLGAHFCNAAQWVDGVPCPRLTVDPQNPLFMVDADQGLYQRTETGLRFVELINSQATRYEVAPGTKCIEANAFSRLTSLTAVELPEDLEAIGAEAFSGCSALRVVEGSEKLRAVGAGAFGGTALESFYFPETMDYLGRNALMLKPTNSYTLPVAVAKVTVHPNCRRYFMQESFLCERLDDGGVAVLLYYGHDKDVVIPHNATEVRSFCLVNAESVRSIHTHDGVNAYEADSFLAKNTVGRIVVDLVNHPVEGHTQVVFCYPDNSTGREAIRQSFVSRYFTPSSKIKVGIPPVGAYEDQQANTEAKENAQPSLQWSVKNAYDLSDEAMYWNPDVFDTGVYVLGRLMDPVMLSVESRNRFEPMIQRRTADVLLAFVERAYRKGMEQMFELGLINKDNVTELIDRAAAVNNVESMGYLFELRRRYFGYNVMAEFDL